MESGLSSASEIDIGEGFLMNDMFVFGMRTDHFETAHLTHPLSDFSVVYNRIELTNLPTLTGSCTTFADVTAAV